LDHEVHLVVVVREFPTIGKGLIRMLSVLTSQTGGMLQRRVLHICCGVVVRAC
jgi:hypothetical protein